MYPQFLDGNAKDVAGGQEHDAEERHCHERDSHGHGHVQGEVDDRDDRAGVPLAAVQRAREVERPHGRGGGPDADHAGEGRAVLVARHIFLVPEG